MLKIITVILALLCEQAYAQKYQFQVQKLTIEGYVVSVRPHEEIFSKVAKEEGVPVGLLRAICWAESKLEPLAYNHGDGTGSNHAFGICQVLNSTAKDYGFSDANCTKDFSNKASRSYKGCKLFGLETNVRYAAKFLKSKLDQYDQSWIHATAAYNAGTVRICKTGVVTRAKDKSVLWKCKKGGILNQKYVDDVLKALEEHR